MIDRPFRVAASVAGGILSVVALSAFTLVGTASAGGTEPMSYTGSNDCADVVSTSTATSAGWSFGGTGGKAVLNADPNIAKNDAGKPVGVLMTTGKTDNNDYALWKFTLPTPVKVGKIDKMSYRTIKLDTQSNPVDSSQEASLPAFRVYLDVPNVGPATLIWEPYWALGNASPPRNVNTNWDVSGSGKFWTNKTLSPDYPQTAGGPPTKTWAQIQQDYPNATIVGYGVGLGTYNRGTIAWMNEVKVKVQGDTCRNHTWTQPGTTSPSPSVSVSKSTSPSPSSSATGSPAVTVTASPGTPGGPSLPVTGFGATGVALLGFGLAVAGVIGVALSRQRRRNRPHFSAE